MNAWRLMETKFSLDPLSSGRSCGLTTLYYLGLLPRATLLHDERELGTWVNPAYQSLTFSRNDFYVSA